MQAYKSSSLLVEANCFYNHDYKVPSSLSIFGLMYLTNLVCIWLEAGLCICKDLYTFRRLDWLPSSLSIIRNVCLRFCFFSSFFQTSGLSLRALDFHYLSRLQLRFQFSILWDFGYIYIIIIIIILDVKPQFSYGESGILKRVNRILWQVCLKQIYFNFRSWIVTQIPERISISD